MLLTSVLGSLSQEIHEFKVSLGYIGRPCLENSKKDKIQMKVYEFQINT
jgi:hypothetical protein